VGIVSLAEARAAAEAASMDLVLIADQSDPVVCKIMDYGKHIFEAKKQKNAQKKKQRRTQLKEMKFRPGTEEGDYQVKLRNLVRFLENGDKAKVTLRFAVVKWPTRRSAWSCSSEWKPIWRNWAVSSSFRKWKAGR
jgi:translation initiation factor IF-3